MMEFPVVMQFAVGDKVVVKHQREMGECVVTNPYDETDMKRVGGQPVGFYVRIDVLGKKGKKNQGYHASSLEKV